MMKGDYLWDGSGEPDLEVVRLERALAGARYDEEVDLPVQEPRPPMAEARPGHGVRADRGGRRAGHLLVRPVGKRAAAGPRDGSSRIGRSRVGLASRSCR